VEIVLFDKGPYVSFANCGLPYYVGNVIKEEKSLLLSSAETFKSRFNIAVKTNHEVVSIDRAGKSVTVRTDTGEEVVERYDKLVLAPGASALTPPIPGIDLPGLFSLRTIPDSRLMRDWITDHGVKTAVVVGGGFIGIEMAENLAERGIAVTLVEGQPQILPPMDPEMVVAMEEAMAGHGVKLALGQLVAGFEEAQSADGRRTLHVKTKSGETHEGDMVILGLGVTPNSKIAGDAGLELGARRGGRVNANMQTLSDPDIFAVGDVVEVTDWVTHEQEQLPMAGPANRQGRLAADAIAGRGGVSFRGVQGTAVCGAFGYVAACTGAAEKTLRRLGQPFRKVYLHPGHHVGYYPGSHVIHLKVLYDPDTGKVLGGQACGQEGTEKRVDVLSMAIQSGMTVFDLEEAELCYSPQFGAAKDPVNMAGFIASNDLRGDAPLATWADVLAPGTAPPRAAGGPGVLLDVREAGEWESGHVEGAVHIPLGQLRDRMGELPRDQPIHVTCLVGQRGYYATRALRLNGYDARNVTGGMKSYHHFKAALENGAALFPAKSNL